jgi:hypothetical protein
MIDSISNAAQDRAQDTLGVTIALAQGFPSLPCERSRRPTRPPCIRAEYGINHQPREIPYRDPYFCHR